MFVPITVFAIVFSLVAAENNVISDVAKNVMVRDNHQTMPHDSAIVVKSATECENLCLNDPSCRSFTYLLREENKNAAEFDSLFKNGNSVCFKSVLPFAAENGVFFVAVASTLVGYHAEPKVGIKNADGSYTMYASTAIWYLQGAEILDTTSETMTVKQCSQRCTDNKDCMAFSHWPPYKEVQALNVFHCNLFNNDHAFPPIELGRMKIDPVFAPMTSVTGNIAARKSDNCMKELESCLSTYQTCCRKVDLLTEMCPESCNGNACKTNFQSCKSDGKTSGGSNGNGNKNDVKDKSSKPATNDASVSASFGAAAIMSFLAAI